jgi:uncharacterized protein YoaH (UPF0181 family)
MKKHVQALAMSRVLTIDYYWRCESFKKGIPPKLAEALEETAFDRIQEQMKDGVVSGELIDYVNMDIPGRKTPEDGWECHGWWNLKKEDEPTSKLNTVNVIEEDDGAVIRMASFQDDKEGNALAEKFFEDIMKTRPEFSKSYLKTCLEGGMFESLRYRILLVHSTEPTV